MKIVVVGTGYVGLVTGTCFAETGNNVTCVDIDSEKIEKLNNGVVPIFEPGLKTIILKNKNLFFTNDLKQALQNSELVFIAVGTPMQEDGSADLKYVLDVARSIGQLMLKRLVIVNKSTVPVGTGDKVKETIQKELDLRGSKLEFDVVSNPEFLKEGVALADFMKPDRVIIGSDSHFATKKMMKLYNPFITNQDQLIIMDIRSAEMTKYAANAMLATKISFINEIANICEKVGADVDHVRIGIGSDRRIGNSFINPGTGYGGSCFPKDIKALSKIAKQNGYNAQIINAVEEVNDSQKLVISRKIINRYGEDLTGFTFAIWGLAFKPDTDDVREAPSIYLIKDLLKRGARINVYDPKAIDQAERYFLSGFNKITYCKSKYDVLDGSDALVLMTEWEEFHSPNFNEIKIKLKNPVIFDGRNQFISNNLENIGFEYYRIGKK